MRVQTRRVPTRSGPCWLLPAVPGRCTRHPSLPGPPHQVVSIHQLENLGEHLLCATGHAVDVVTVALEGGGECTQQGSVALCRCWLLVPGKEQSCMGQRRHPPPAAPTPICRSVAPADPAARSAPCTLPTMMRTRLASSRSMLCLPNASTWGAGGQGPRRACALAVPLHQSTFAWGKPCIGTRCCQRGPARRPRLTALARWDPRSRRAQWVHPPAW